MYVQRLTVPVTTASDGTATVTSGQLRGVIRAIRYVPDGTTPLTNTATVTITGSVSGIAVLTVAAIGSSAVDFYPRGATVDVSDGAALYDAGGKPVLDLIPVADESLQIVVSGGGNAKLGTFHVYLDGQVAGS